MRRGSFIGGLTLMLLLLLGLSGYGAWIARGLTSDLNRLTADNHEKIRAIGDVRSAGTNASRSQPRQPSG